MPSADVIAARDKRRAAKAAKKAAARARDARPKGGPDEGQSPGSTSEAVPSSPAVVPASTDAPVIATNDESFSSKVSTIVHRYMRPPPDSEPHSPPPCPPPSALPAMASKMAVRVGGRSPLIHRGYHLRVAGLTRVLHNAARIAAPPSPDDPTAITLLVVAIGAGFDSAPVDVLTTHSHVHLVDVDFPSVLAQKEVVLEQVAPSVASSGRYTQVRCDLRETEQLATELSRVASAVGPITVLTTAECVLNYLEAAEGDRVIKTVRDVFGGWGKPLYMATYEQIVPDDAFGQVMRDNLTQHYAPLRAVATYHNTRAHEERYLRLGFAAVEAVDLNEYWRDWFSDEERQRVEGLEMFDEWEDLLVKCAHYFLLVASLHDDKMDGRRPLWLFGDEGRTPAVPPRRKAVSVSAKPAGGPSRRTSSRPADLAATLASAGPGQRCAPTDRWGHTVVLDVAGDALVAFGGFGAGSGPHGRLASLATRPAARPLARWTKLSVRGTAPTARQYHCAWMSLPSRRMWVFGGRTTPHSLLDDVCQFDVGAGCWRSTRVSGDVPSARARATATPLGDGRVLLLGGRVHLGGNTFSSVPLDHGFIFTEDRNDPEAATWTRVELGGDVPTPRHSHAAVLLQGGDGVLVCGGLQEGATMSSRVLPCDSLALLDVDTMTWRRVDASAGGSSVPPPLMSASLVRVDGQVVLLGGVSNDGAAGAWLREAPLPMRMLELDVAAATATWSRLLVDPMPSERDEPYRAFPARFACVAVGRKVILTGGGGLCFSFGVRFNADLEVAVSRTDLEGVEATADVDGAPPASATGDVVRVNAGVADWRGESILAARQPVLLQGLSFGATSSAWEPSELAALGGDKRVSVHRLLPNQDSFDFLAKNFDFDTMRWSDLLAEVFGDAPQEGRPVYLRALGTNARKQVANLERDWPALAAAFTLPDSIGVPADRIFSSVLRVSSQGTRLWTHYDTVDNVLFALRGDKRVELWPPSAAGDLNLDGSSSRWRDPAAASPVAAASRSHIFLLRAGEALVLPALWAHRVTALTPCISINVFYRDGRIAPADISPKDLYGNHDVVSAQQALAAARDGRIDQALQLIAHLPRDYREFYGSLIAQCVRDRLL